jgi:hypothetical protein
VQEYSAVHINLLGQSSGGRELCTYLIEWATCCGVAPSVEASRVFIGADSGKNEGVGIDSVSEPAKQPYVRSSPTGEAALRETAVARKKRAGDRRAARRLWGKWDARLWSGQQSSTMGPMGSGGGGGRVALDTDHRFFLQAVPRLYDLRVASAAALAARCRATLRWYDARRSEPDLDLSPIAVANFAAGIVLIRAERWRDAVRFFSRRCRCRRHRLWP